MQNFNLAAIAAAISKAECKINKGACQALGRNAKARNGQM